MSSSVYHTNNIDVYLPVHSCVENSKGESFVRAFACGSIETKGMPARIRTFLNSFTFYPDLCGLGLKALWKAVSIGDRIHWLRVDGRLIRVKLVCGFKNICMRVNV